MFAIAGMVFIVLWLLSTAVFQLTAPVGQTLLTLALVCGAIFAVQQVRARRRSRQDL